MSYARFLLDDELFYQDVNQVIEIERVMVQDLQILVDHFTVFLPVGGALRNSAGLEEFNNRSRLMRQWILFVHAD